MNIKNNIYGIIYMVLWKISAPKVIGGMEISGYFHIYEKLKVYFWNKYIEKY